jgi:cysteine synthase B
MHYTTIEQTIGNTPLVKLQRLNPNKSNTILLKLEGNNPAGSVKDRAALNMISQAERRGEISAGDTLISAKSRAPSIPAASLTKINSAPYATIASLRSWERFSGIINIIL